MKKSNDLGRRKAELSEAKRALLLKRLQGKKPGEQTGGGIQRQPQEDPLPLSYTQQRVWFLQQLFPDNRAYNMSEAWRLRGPLDVDALQQALQTIVRRHSSLRTCFITVDNVPVQKVASEVALSLLQSDISHLPASDRERELLGLLLAEGNYAFDLGHEPLIRPSLIRLESDEHVLQLVLHHIITDEWSNDILWRELSFYYDKARQSGSGDLPQNAIQYSDYARWQRDQVASGALDRQMNYWRAQLSGDLPLLQLPYDRPRPLEQSLRGGTIRRMLPADLLHGLQRLSQQAGTTLYNTLLAAFQVLLYRYSGQEDILVGTPIANRQQAQTENVIGMFINTAVMRANVTREISFHQFLAQVKQAAVDALANQDLPFDLLVQDLHPNRDLSHNPLFQAMFVYRSDSVKRTLTTLELEPIKIDRGVSKFDLTLFAGEEGGRLMSALEYSSDLFDETSAVRMLDAWQALLEGLVDDPHAAVDTLPLLNPVERNLVVETWNDTVVPFSETRPLFKLIADIAAQDPQKEAVIAGDKRLTYDELEKRANTLANRLLKHGITPGTPVGLYTERSASMVVGILGIQKAGGAYVPLEPAYPAERILFSLADTGAPVIVTQAHLADGLPATDAVVVILDAGLDEQSVPPKTAATLDDLAYIIYTSGSTGTPKGVMVTHGNLLSSTLARGVTYDTPVERYLLLSSFAFDSSVAGIFWTLASGGALVLPAPDDEKDVQALASLISKERVTHTLALPTLYRLILIYAPPHSLDSLKVVIVAGEACPPDVGEKHYNLIPGCALYNEYGPTEATVWCSVYRLPEEGNGRTVPIGRPIANSQLYILDSHRQPLPVGVPGELYIGGAGVTPGYWQRPQLTKERFTLLDLVALADDGRVYRTGDLARWRSDGQVEFLGRVDNQVKIRGFRIELGEIEALLLRHPDVEEAVAIIWEQPVQETSSDRSLVAYVAGERLKDGAHTNEKQLLSYLRESLPEYMVPQNLVLISKMPHTPNGKIDRKRLPKPQIERDRTRTFVAPRNSKEETLARIWREILHLPQVSIDEKFFELGGDSIMSIQVIARTRQEGLILTPRQLFQEQTIARLAAVATQSDLVPRPQSEIHGAVSLTPIQHWFFEQQLIQPAHWNQAVWFETDDDLDLETFKLALEGLVSHHPMLRARYRRVNGNWLQEVSAEAPSIVIESISLAGLNRPAQDEMLLANATRLHATLDLAQGPLLRGAWFNLGAGRRPRLLLTIHHLIVDAISWGILMPDLVAAYSQLSAGKPLSLPAPTTNYSQWAEVLLQMARGAKLQQEKTFWLGAVQPTGLLPKDNASGNGNTEGDSDLVAMTLDEMRTGQLLREVHRAYNTRIDDVLLTALTRAVGEWSDNRSLLLTVERHGREDIDAQVDLSRTVGWFTCLFPLTLSLTENDDEGSALRSVKEQLRAVPQNGIGYGLLRYLGDEDTRRQLEALPQPEILFNYLGVAQSSEDDTNPVRFIAANTGQLYGPQNSRAHVIDVNARVENGRLTARWQYAPALFHKETITNVAEAFFNELARLIDHCLEVDQGQHTPSDFPLANLAQDDLDSLSDLLAELD